ncbi:MAG: ribulose-phosphate 3-epimerase [Saprospiraceae bacterium]|nr:ribulose-phosphate 3-epimerase [Saprospiraceae bacterium]
MHIIAPSLLAADFSILKEEIEMVNTSEADWLHLDIMDGRYVPNISFGFPVLDQVKKYSKKPMDVHLMIIEPEKYLERFAKVGANLISVHYEACTHLHRTIYQIKELGCKAGIALNPHTPVSHLTDIIGDIDLVCVMSVNPGFGGQKFIANTYNKIKALVEISKQVNPGLLIEIDGGVDQQNARKLIDCGANVLVAGSSVFSNENPLEAIKKLKHC